jgi:hypothetical protein
MGKRRINKYQKFISLTIVIMMIIALVTPGYRVHADSSTIDQRIAAAEAELEDLYDRQEAAEEQRKIGTLGFIDYMLTKTDLTSVQRTDLNNARQFIEDAMEEDFVESKLDYNDFPAFRKNKVTAVDDPYDAIALVNYPRMFEELRNVNVYRAIDDLYVGNLKCYDSYVNFYYTAVAQVGADRAAGYKAHNMYGFCCECLAFGCYIEKWYDEKELFEKAMSQLGMTQITSRADVKKVEAKADENGDVVGHYTNLFAAEPQVMGMGFAQYGRYRDTTCYNAVNLNKSTTAYYTIDEFEALYNEYYATVEPEQFEIAIADKKAQLESLYEEKYAACSGHSFTETGHVDPGCSTEGYDYKKCSKCGYIEKSNFTAALGHDLADGICSRCGIKTVKSLDSVSWQCDNYIYTSSKLALEEGKSILLNISFTTAKDNLTEDDFVVDISDTSVLSYTPISNRRGTINLNKTGVCKVTIYPKEVPELARTYDIDVTDVGGHMYEVSELQSGKTTSTATCSKCGLEREVEIPTSIGTIYYNSTGTGQYSTINTVFNPNSTGYMWVMLDNCIPYKGMDNAEIIVESSDESVIKYNAGVSGDGDMMGSFTTGNPGTAQLTIYPKYNPSLKKIVKLAVMGEDGVKATSVKVSPSTIKLDLTKNPTAQATAEVSPENAVVKDVMWEIDEDSPIAEVDSTGKITAKDKGETWLFAVTYDKSNVYGYAYVEIYDTPAAPSVTADDFEVTETSVSSKLTNTNYQYRIKKNGSWSSWSDTKSWSNLDADTPYEIGVRTKANLADYIKASDEAIISLNTDGHIPEVIKGKEATCTESGLTDGSKCSTCGKILKAQEVIPAKGHTEVTDNAVPATCTDTGLTEGKHCSVCKEVIVKQQVVPANGHAVVIDKGYKETCETAGLTDGSHCSVCGEILTNQEVIPASGHQWDLGVITTEPTCEEFGVRTFTCYICDGQYTEQIDKLGHDIVVIHGTAATCTESGLTDGAVCSRCDHVEIPQEVIPATGHPFGDWIQDPDNPDKIYRLCDICGYKEESEHRWDTGTVTLEPTCTEEGERVLHCLDCGAEKTESIPASRHLPKVEKGYDATCVSEGFTDKVYCSVCNQVLVDSEVIPALGHAWDEGVVTRKETCTVDGERLFICTRDDCDETRTEAIKAPGHTEEIIPSEAPTCTEKGKTEGKKCSVCGEILESQSELDVLGHSWDDGIVTTEATCVKDGVKTFTCQRKGCNETRTEVIKASGHIEETLSAEAPTCTEKGKTEGKKCSVCGEILQAQSEVKALGHSWDDGKITRSATCIEEGEKTFTCNRDGCGETRIETIKKEDHIPVDIPEIPATCTSNGQKGGKKCSVCNTILINPTVVAAYGHKEVIDPESPPTYDKTGLTEGSHCSVCGVVIKKQEIIPRLVPKIITQPVDKKAVYGNTAAFTVKTEGEGLKYQWQYSTDGKTWKNSGALGNKTVTLSITAAKSNNNLKYRCAVTGGETTVYSNAAILTSLPAISVQPTNKTAVCDDKVTFSLTSRASKATFQWQYSTDGNAWKTSSAIGNKTNSLTVTAAAANNNVKYRCIVKNGSSTEYSSAVTLTVKAKITSQPVSQTAVYDTTVKFTVKAAGPGLTYQWQYSSDGKTWKTSTAAGSKTATLSIRAAKNNNNLKYRCIVKSGSQTLTSASAKLTTKAK